MIDICLATEALHLGHSDGQPFVCPPMRNCAAEPEAVIAAVREAFGGREAMAFLWMANTAVWGKWTGENLDFFNIDRWSPKYLVELRVFSEDAEIRFVRSGDTLRFRCISLAKEAGKDYVDSLAPFYGEAQEKDGHLIVADEARKLSMEIPVPHDGNSKTYGLATRNYIGQNEIGQAGYVDSRFMGVVSVDGRK